MDCAGFERELFGLLAGDSSLSEREGRIAELRAHQAGCPACRGSSILLDWLALSWEERRGFEDPGPEYWTALPGRVREAIGEQEARRARVQGLALAGAVAAGVLLASTVAWLLFGNSHPARVEPGPAAVELRPGHRAAIESLPAPPRGREPIGEPEPALPEPPDESEGSAEVPEDVLAALGDEDLWSEGEVETGIGEGGWLFPDVEDLDEPTRRALLDWLRAERARIDRG